MDAFINACATGTLSSFSKSSHSSLDSESDVMQAYKAVIFCGNGMKPFCRSNFNASQLKTAQKYSNALSTIEKALSQNKDALRMEMDRQLPLHIQFEQCEPLDRMRLILYILQTCHTLSHVPHNLCSSELFRANIYVNDLATILLLIRRSFTLQSIAAFELHFLISFCLSIYNRGPLLCQIALNDPGSVDRVIESVLNFTNRSICANKRVVQWYPILREALLSIANLPNVYFASRILYILKRYVHSEKLGCAAASIALQILCSVQEMHSELAGFLYANVQKESYCGMLAFLKASNESDSGRVNGLDQDARRTMLGVQEILLTQLRNARSENSAFSLMLTMKSWIYVIGVASSQESVILQVLQSLDELMKEESGMLYARTNARVVSIAYVLVIVACYNFLSSQSLQDGDVNSTKLLIAAAQQCIFSLYNARVACPALILGPILLYTKSAQVLTFLSTIMQDGTESIAQVLVPDRLFLVSDHILKPILSEQTMAREMLTFSPVSYDAFQPDLTLDVLHRLLCERSFLRHHHGRRLEQWLTSQLNVLALPIHPLMKSILIEFVENYIMAFEYPISQTPLQLAVIPLRTSFVRKALNASCLNFAYDEKESTDWARGVTTLAYVLHFNQRLTQVQAMSSSKVTHKLANSHLGGDICLAYALNASVPIRNIWKQVRLYSSAPFVHIAPVLDRLLTETYLHLDTMNMEASDNWIERIFIRSKTNKAMVQQIWSRKALVILENEKDWLEMDQFISDACVAPEKILMLDWNVILQRILPLAVFSYKGQAVLEAVVQKIAYVYFLRVSSEHSAPECVYQMLCQALCVPELLYHKPLQAEDVENRSSITCIQLLRQCHPSVLTSPGLTELLCCVVRELWRTETSKAKRMCIYDAESRPQSQAVLVQDCLLFHSILRCADPISDLSAPNTQRIRSQLGNLLHSICIESEGQKTSPQLLIAVHSQAYSCKMIPFVIKHVKSMRNLWKYWLQCNYMSEFIVNAHEQKQLLPFHRLQFRLQLFFAFVCRFYRTDTSEVSRVVVDKLMKHVLSKKLPMFIKAFVLLGNEKMQPWNERRELCDEKRVSFDMIQVLFEAAAQAACVHASYVAELTHVLLKIRKEHRMRERLEILVKDTFSVLLHHAL